MADMNEAAPQAVQKSEKGADRIREAMVDRPRQVFDATAQGVKGMQAEMSDKLRASTEKVTQGVHDMQADMSGSLKQVGELAAAYVDAQRSAMETVVKAGQIYGEGLQSLVTRAADANRTQFEHALAHFRALSGVKSIKEAVSLQTQFARAMTSRALTEGSTLVEDYLKVTSQALAPVTERARATAEKVKHAA